MTEVSALGEFGLIQRLTSKFSIHHSSTLKGVGDDSAIIDSKGKKVVISTDLLVEGIHFDMMYTPLKHLGYKAVVVNLSDIYAMNAHPEHITVSLAISSRFTVEALEEIYEGIALACKHYKVDLIGGDTTSSLKGLVLSVTAIGFAEQERIVYRNGAKPGDLIVVSGDLGAAYLGLQLLEREKRIFLEDQNIKPDLEQEQYLIGRQLKPEARKDVIAFLDEVQLLPTAMLDISDGLSSDMLHICSQSDVGCELYEDELPIADETVARAETFKLDPTMCALNGGEDYELLFTICEEDESKIVSIPGLSIIGRVTAKEDGCILLTKGGNRVAITAQGWNHFTSKL